jgi:hypothetical protein
MGRKNRMELNMQKIIAKEQHITIHQARKKYVTRPKDMSFLDE